MRISDWSSDVCSSDLLIQRKARRLPLLAIDIETEPREISANRIDIFFLRPLAVGVVAPQQDPPAMLPRPQPIVERGANIAEMPAAGRRGGEGCNDGHSAHLQPLWTLGTDKIYSRRLGEAEGGR